jgi:uncharacterized protein (UPF0332 family)
VREQEVDELVRYRLEQADAALADAQFLLEGNRSPHSIVNRAYYAMFYGALALLQKIGKVPTKHVGAIALFDTEFVKPGILGRELSQDFHRAFELRQMADYRVLESPSRERAEETCQKATRFVAAVKRHLLWRPASEEG